MHNEGDTGSQVLRAAPASVLPQCYILGDPFFTYFVHSFAMPLSLVRCNTALGTGCTSLKRKKEAGGGVLN
eukprot:625815-Amphidinium_carterae.1